MKKGKLEVSKFSSAGFTFQKNDIDLDAYAKTIKVPEPEYADELEADSAIQLEYIRDILEWTDKNPPQTGNVLDSNIYFVIVFESRQQKDKWLKDADLFRIGDKYLDGALFAEAFGIDLKKGVIVPKKGKKNTIGNGGATYAFGGAGGLDFGKFGKQKKEIGETLKNIRKDERKLQDYLLWVIEAEYWLCLCFKNEDDKASMLKALGLELEYNGKYLWCEDVAKAVGLPLEPCDHKDRAFSGKQDPKLCSLVKERLPDIGE